MPGITSAKVIETLEKTIKQKSPIKKLQISRKKVVPKKQQPGMIIFRCGLMQCFNYQEFILTLTGLTWLS